MAKAFSLFYYGRIIIMEYLLTDFIPDIASIPDSSPSYYYQGYCVTTGELLRLPRTSLAEVIAKSLMQQLSTAPEYNQEGKMYGVLIVESAKGQQRVLKAFSGLLNGCSQVPGWVPPIPGREEVVADEVEVLRKLEAIKQEILELENIPQRQEYQDLQEQFSQKLLVLNQLHQQRKQQRHQQREKFLKTITGSQLDQALAELGDASRRDGIERKVLKKERDALIIPLQEIIRQADQKIHTLKQQRKQLSRQLQTQMHGTYTLMNFLGQSQTLQQLQPSGLPTGTGDCCAPKLLHYAAKRGFKAIAMAEFWWGQPTSDKIPGNFYGACAERCQPIMGFLLSGLNAVSSSHHLEVIYEDEFLIAINKPANLLSVPGRYLHTQDSVLSRIRNYYGDGNNFLAVHRLDLETSGILLIARNLDTYRQLSQQFQQRLVTKVYEALLDGVVENFPGLKNPIELPLWGNPDNRPYQEVNWLWGKPSITYVHLMDIQNHLTRIEFRPITGRTHQLRVHAVHPQGLDTAILGDQLYSPNSQYHRLCLHAREIEFVHPQFGEKIHLKTPTPF